MQLRAYQQRAFDAAVADLREHNSTLLVAATGTGKTVIFGHIGKHFAAMNGKRVLVLAHRQELIYQARDKVAAVTREVPDIEMGAEWADRPSLHDFKSDFVISTIQTQIAGRGGQGRMSRFSPDDFCLVIVDEAHHAPADSYRKVIDYYRQNPDIKVLGVTATPDRADEAALGQVFDKVSFVYEINDGIIDGYLVPIEQRSVIVDGLDFSAVKTTAGDLNVADLGEIMIYERALHGVAHPTFELSAGRKTLVFAASVAHAERLCEIFNRHEFRMRTIPLRGTDDVTRKATLRDFKAGRFRFLCNVGVLTEGYDEPTVECVAIARPTKSRALYAQMVGRGTRPLPGIVDAITDAEGRRDAIRRSSKPKLEVLDFEGNAGKHKLMTCADILGGKYDDDVVELAQKKARGADGPVDVQVMLDEAQEEMERERKEAVRQRDAATRKALIAKANYSTQIISAFDVLDLTPERERGWHKGRKPSEKQIEMLLKNGIQNAAELSFTHASQLIQNIIDRRNQSRCTFKQAKLLRRHGYPANISFAAARQIIDGLAANGWRRPERALVGISEGEL